MTQALARIAHVAWLCIAIPLGVLGFILWIVGEIIFG
jgi:hypothetical protein